MDNIEYFIVRSCVEDAGKAIALKPNYPKAIIRAAQASAALQKYEECIHFCDLLLVIDPKHRAALDLRKEIVQKKANKDRDERKTAAALRKKETSEKQTFEAIAARGVRFEEHRIDDQVRKITAQLIKPQLEPLEDHPVHLDEEGALVWPLAICYPEFLFSDFHHNISENAL